MQPSRGDGGVPSVGEPRIRIRGIYATALSALLRTVGSVVQATPPIQERFETPFPTVEHDVAITTTDDRLGVGVYGDPTGVETIVDRLSDVAIDTFDWGDRAPPGAVFEAEVLETRGNGAVVELGPREAFLPFDEASDYVEEGQVRRMQVQDPAPPWSDRRPEVGEEIRAGGGLASLVRGLDSAKADVRDSRRASELVRTTDVLPTDPLEGWGVRWELAAANADLDALDEALARANERAGAVDEHEAGGEPPAACTWIQFGRESRFVLDEVRRDVVPTMPGHHRIKAGGRGSSTAVDLVERVAAGRSDTFDGPFPFEAVADTFGPATGDTFEIVHGKPEGRRFPLGRGTVTNRDGETVTVRREMTAGGAYDALGVLRETGDVAITKLTEGRWWYPTVYRNADDETKGTYVNVCTPVELFPNAASYVDLHVDVIRHADGEVERVDDDELDAAVDAGHVSERLAEKAREVATAVERGLS